MVRIIIETNEDGSVRHAATLPEADEGATLADAGGPPADLLAQPGAADAFDMLNDDSGAETAGGPPPDLLAQLGEADALDDGDAEEAGGPPPDLGGEAVSFDAQVAGNDAAEDMGGPPAWLIAAVDGVDDAGSSDESDIKTQ